MYKRIIIAVALLLSLLLPASALADIEDAIQNNAKAALLLDASTGTVVYARNEHERMPVASITKVMTLYLIFEAMENGLFTMDDMVTVSHNAQSMGGSQVYIEANGQYKVNDLVKSIIIASGNDACVAMSEFVAGSETAFVDRMNDKARELGLTNTHYANCTGLPAEDNYMSAHDVAVLSSLLIDHDVFFNYSKIYTDELIHPDGRKTSLTNTNRLINTYNGCDGIKTGFTNDAMYCLSATAKRGDTRLIAVVLGEPTINVRNNDIAEMFNYGFANYKTELLFAKNQIIKENLHIFGAEQIKVSAVAMDDICAFIEKENSDKVTHTITLREDICAPVSKGDIIGNIDIYMDGNMIDSYGITVNRDVKRATFGQCLGFIASSFCYRGYYNLDEEP